MGMHGYVPPSGPPSPGPRKSTGKTVAIVLLSIYALLSTAWGCTATLAAGSSSTGASLSADTSSQSAEPTEEAPEDEPTTAVPVHPTKKDLRLGIKELERSCYGSAGCNVTYRIRVKLVNPEKFDSTTTYEVSYRVTGGESDYVSTPPNPSLKVAVTEIEARL